MGQQTSFIEFSNEVSKLHLVKCDILSSTPLDPTWKTLFLTSMTDDEICSFFSFDDVRRLRRFHPDRLAMVLFKCIEQLKHFADHWETISDYCSVMNALRMIGNALPYCFEDIELKGTELKDNTIVTKRTLDKQGVGILSISPFATHFARHLFWENKTCEGVDLGQCDKISKWSSRPLEFDAPLGEILVQSIVRLCFIPKFSVAVKQLPAMELEKEMVNPHDGKVAESVKVYQELLWFGGSGASAVSTAAWFRQIDSRRIQLLRALTQCLCVNVFEADENLHNPFLSVLVDNDKCPLSPTLCLSMVHRIVSYNAKGTLPYTSYVGAETGEKMLAFSLSLLAVAFDNPSPAANCFVRVFSDLVDSDAVMAEMLVIGLHRVIDNPLYSSRTWLKDSQKQVECCQEALVVLFHVQEFANIKAFTVKHLRLLMYPLLFFVQECARADDMFSEMQLALYILLRLSSSREFLGVIVNEPIPSQPPLFVLPDIMKHSNEQATYGDVLVLMMCFVVSPASPRWFLPAFPAAATIFSNVLTSVLGLKELTCFEIHHTLDFLVQRNVLKKGPNAQQTVQLWVEGIVSVVERSPKGVVPLIASLGVGTSAIHLKRMIEGQSSQAALENQPAVDDDTVSTRSADSRTSSSPHQHPIRFIENFEGDMPLSSLLRISEDAKKKIDASNLPTTLAGKRGDIYDAMENTSGQSDLTIPSAAPLVRNFVVSPAIRFWLSGAIWRALHRRNTRPPLFDFKTVKLY